MAGEGTKPTLPFYEKLTACLIVSFFLFLGLINFYLDDGKLPNLTGQPHFTLSPLLEVRIEGAVQNPGVYQVKKGITVQEALELATPLEEANLKRIKLDSKILRRRTIKITSAPRVRGQMEKNG